MTATTTPAATTPAQATGRSLSDDTRQFIAVLAVLVVAMIVAVAVKTFAENQTRSVSAGGVSASIPADWVYQPGGGDLLFVAHDPRIQGHRYLVSRTAAGGRGLREAVDMYSSAKAQLLSAYQPISREQVTIGSRTGEAVTYAFVVEREGKVPQVIQARDVYFEDGDKVLVISTEGPAAQFEDSLGDFDAFVRSVGV